MQNIRGSEPPEVVVQYSCEHEPCRGFPVKMKKIIIVCKDGQGKAHVYA